MDRPAKDQLYAKPLDHVGDFVFDDNVAGVFEDMIQRSVPGYRAIIRMIGVLAEQYARPGTRLYDLGCSLGAASAAMLRGVPHDDCRIVAVDNSPSMIRRCAERLRPEGSGRVDLVCADVQNVKVTNASMAVLNFTLQFIPVEDRQALLRRIHDGLVSGGILVLSEKIAFADPKEDAFQTQMHHAFKKLHGYSDLEIAQKRTSLERVLLADTLEAHRDRLMAAGFRNVQVWFQCFNFISLVAHA